MQSSSERPRIAAVVVTYNRCERLQGCLEALLHQERPLDEILVIDNASTDNSREMLKEKFEGKITNIRMKENLGGAYGFYEGVRLAFEKGHDWIWVMDDDVEPEPDALKALVDSPAFSDPSVGYLGSLIVNPSQVPQLWMYCRFNLTLGRRIHLREKDLNAPLLHIEGGSFVGSMFRRKAIETLGFPIKDFFIYWDDTEYTYRISTKFKTFLVPSSVVIHRNALGALPRRRLLDLFDISPGLPLEQAWRSYYLIRNGIFFRTRSGSWWFLPYILIASLARPVAVVVFLRNHKLKRCKIFWQATIDGIKGRLGKQMGP